MIVKTPTVSRSSMYKFLATVGQKGYIVTARTAFCCEITGEGKAKQIEREKKRMLVHCVHVSKNSRLGFLNNTYEFDLLNILIFSVINHTENKKISISF